MKYLVGVASLALLAVVIANVKAEADAKVTVKDAMGKLHKGATSLKAAIEKDLKDEKWDAVAKNTKDYAATAAATEGDPKKGDKEAFKKLMTAWSADAKALDAAAGKKDKAGAEAALKKISGACAGCHKDHK